MAHATSRSRTMPPGHARRTRRQTLVLILLAVALVAASAFGWLAYAVTHQELVEANTSLELAVHAQATPALDGFFKALTFVGSVPAIGVLTLILAGALLARGRREDGVLLAATMAGSVGLTEGLKHAFHQARPTLFATALHEHGFSFPSGHATLSFSLFGFIALWLVLQAPRRAVSWLAGLACLALAASIALSRVYLGAHWPSDVLAGMLVATAWVTAVTAARYVLLPPLEV
jgi:undecaprenyl-diphosphatase